MPQRKRGRSPARGAVAPAYEGPDILGALLARAGSTCSAAEAADRFRRALTAGEARAAVIPTLFPREPRFASPDEARRLYQNLFGLWERVASGRGAEEGEEGGPPEPPPPAAPLPERGTATGDCLPPDLVEAVWRYLADLPQKEARRVRHRFESSQPDLVAWLAQVELPESGAVAALDLCFEAWAMLDQAFGERLGAASWRVLDGLASEPPPLEADQPALAVYAAEQLDNVADEDPAFGPAQRAQVEKVLAAAAAAMVRALG